ncbi:MAG: hypothetical protein NE328_09900 [Lentisphaeraceae bacterium]|nr:hypothetical protein [Lentisphaeraceae bacterium]
MDELNRRTKVKKEMTATSLRIEKDILEKIDNYGLDIERSRNWVVNKLLRQALADLNKF